MEINAAQFQKDCVQLLEKVHALNKEIIITKHGKPWAKLAPVDDPASLPFIGSLTGVGRTVGDVLAPFDDEWGV